jgi:Zn-dependent peptidase ImmA (M78 family)
VDVTEVVRRLGIRLELADLGEDCSGMLVRGAGGSVIGVHYAHHPNRQRFTIAHEIGHFELHEGGTYVDRGTTLRLRSNRKNSGSLLEEREANQFAAALLMPATWVRRSLADHDLDLGDDESMRSLCEQFGVSTQAMVYRLTNLGIFEDTPART